MRVRVSIGLIMALGIITLGGAQACARGLAKGSKVAYNSNAAIIATLTCPRVFGPRIS
jgi:hypothetical protein